MTQTDDFMTAGNAPAIKFESIGEVHAITVRRREKRTDTKPDGTIKTWDNGDPMHVWVFNGEDEQGEEATLWVRGNMEKVIREAVAAAGLSTVIDTKVTVKHTGLGEAKRGQNAPKLYAAKVEAVAPATPAYDQESPF